LTKILLRPVLETDLSILFEQQLESEAVAISAYPSKDRGEFMRHWEGILKKQKYDCARHYLQREGGGSHHLLEGREI
jgi:hypothetical protein